MALQFFQESLLRFAWRKNKKKDIKPNGIAQTPLDELGEGEETFDELEVFEEELITGEGGIEGSGRVGSEIVGSTVGSCGVGRETGVSDETTDSSGLPSKHFWKVNSISFDR